MRSSQGICYNTGSSFERGKFMTQTILEFGKLGIGTWYLGDQAHTRKEEIAAIQYGIENNMRIIDTAEMYGNGRSENLVGEAIKPYDRESLYIISKVLPQNANKQRLEASLDASLKQLKTDYLDSYLYHWRGMTPLEETVDMLEQMVDKGKIKSWGVSNFDVEDMEELVSLKTRYGCVMNEVLYHLGSRGIEYALKPFQDKHDIVTIAYCPLAQQGRLKKQLVTNEVVHSIAKERGISVYQVLLCFTLQQDNMVSIPRTSKVAHMKELAACQHIQLTAEEYTLLNTVFPAPKHRVPLDIQ